MTALEVLRTILLTVLALGLLVGLWYAWSYGVLGAVSWVTTRVGIRRARWLGRRDRRRKAREPE